MKDYLMPANLSLLNFSSNENYMKRDASSGESILTLSSGTVTTNIAHNLNFIPQYDVYADLNNDGTIWAGEQIGIYTDTSLFANPNELGLSSSITTTTLTITLQSYSSPLASGNRTVYYIIYKDYGNVS